jgi:ectoine hydroxylase-related dioxygenase (phytanoyl-CoA dioxygenase family)
LLGNLSANIATPGGAGGLLHADQVFVTEPWPAHEPQGVNVAWCLDEFTEDNGATRFVPGSHRLNRSPRPEDGDASVPAIAPAGTMIAFESRLWHRTGANRTDDRNRAALFAWYSRTIYRTQENWFLSLSPWVLEGASDELLTLLAYKTAGFGLVNGHSPR